MEKLTCPDLKWRKWLWGIVGTFAGRKRVYARITGGGGREITNKSFPIASLQAEKTVRPKQVFGSTLTLGHTYGTVPKKALY